METLQLNRLGEILKDRGIKNQWVADRLKITRASVHNYATNKHQPSLEVLYQLATLLQIPPSALLYDDLKVYPKDTARKQTRRKTKEE